MGHQIIDTFVQCRFSRFARGTATIDEPLAILAAMEWLSQFPRFSLFHRLHRDIDSHTPDQTGFEVFLMFYLRHVFEGAPALNEVFTFRGDHAERPDLAWQHEKFELVTVVDPGENIKISPLTSYSGSSANLGLSAKSDEQVVEWISTNAKRYTFCFPTKSFGPGILFFVRSRETQKILLVLMQAKRYRTVDKQTLVGGVRSITPSWLWRSKRKMVR